MSSPTENLMDTIGGIKAAEQEAARIREDARRRAESVLKKAREDALQTAQKMDQDMIAFKDARTRDRHQTTEEEVKSILGKAEKEAVRLRAQHLEKKELEQLAGFVLRV